MVEHYKSKQIIWVNIFLSDKILLQLIIVKTLLT